MLSASQPPPCYGNLELLLSCGTILAQLVESPQYSHILTEIFSFWLWITRWKEGKKAKPNSFFRAPSLFEQSKITVLTEHWADSAPLWGRSVKLSGIMCWHDLVIAPSSTKKNNKPVFLDLEWQLKPVEVTFPYVSCAADWHHSSVTDVNPENEYRFFGGRFKSKHRLGATPQQHVLSLPERALFSDVQTKRSPK